MLEQAIVDAAALREAALKNAEQSIIEKYAPEIKSAVESLLGENWRPQVGESVIYRGAVHQVTTENENGQMGIKQEGGKTFLVQESDLEEADEMLLQEEEMDAMGGGAASYQPAGFEKEIPFGATSGQEMCPCPEDGDQVVFNFSLKDLENLSDQQPAGPEEQMPREDEFGLGGGPPAEEEEEDDLGLGDLFQESKQIEEIMSVLSELDEEEEQVMTEEDEEVVEEEDDDDVLEEELVVDMGEAKDGTFQTNEEALRYQQERQLAKQESDEYKEENEALEKRLEEMSEAKKELQKKTKLYETTIYKLNEKLQSVLLSNAKLLYSNRVLNDASLNERQKSKIVEAINKARSMEEAKTLQETLKVTVGHTQQRGPQSLNETVQRRSNLSSMLTSKRQEPTQEDNFSERMQKLAGIK